MPDVTEVPIKREFGPQIGVLLDHWKKIDGRIVPVFGIDCPSCEEVFLVDGSTNALERALLSMHEGNPCSPDCRTMRGLNVHPDGPAACECHDRCVNPEKRCCDA